MNQTRIFLNDKKVVFNGHFHLRRNDLADFNLSTTECQRHLAISRALAKKYDCLVYTNCVGRQFGSVTVFERIPYAVDVYVETERYEVGWLVGRAFAYCKCVVSGSGYAGDVDTHLQYMLQSDGLGYFTDMHGTIDSDEVLAFKQSLASKLTGQSRKEKFLYHRALNGSAALSLEQKDYPYLQREQSRLSHELVYPLDGTWCEKHDEYGHCC